MINNTVLFRQIFNDKVWAVTNLTGGDLGMISCDEEYTFRPTRYSYNKLTNLQLMEISEFIDNLNTEDKIKDLFVDVAQERLKNNE